MARNVNVGRALLAPVQFPRHTNAGERGIGHQRQALACTVIDDGQDAEATAVGELIRVAWRSRPIVLKMLSFGVIGLGNTVIDFGVFAFAYKVLELPLVASNVLARLVAVSRSYVMNTTVTFRADPGRDLRGRITCASSYPASQEWPQLLPPSWCCRTFSILAGFAVNFAMSHFIAFHPRVRLEEKQASPHQSSADLT